MAIFKKKIWRGVKPSRFEFHWDFILTLHKIWVQNAIYCVSKGCLTIFPQHLLPASSYAFFPAVTICSALAKYIWNLLQHWINVDHCFNTSGNASVQGSVFRWDDSSCAVHRPACPVHPDRRSDYGNCFSDNFSMPFSMQIHSYPETRPISLSFLNSEPLNTRPTRDVEAMINVDSKLKQISNIFG